VAGTLPRTGAVSARQIDAWLAELDIEPLERSERDGISSWDLSLDGRRRRGVRLTLILEPDLVLVAWLHYAPALSDGFRRSYRQFLRWNDELPFVKFALSADERPMLTAELAAETLDRDRLGLTLARLLAVCDLLLDESAGWLRRGGRARPEPLAEEGSPSPVLERYAAELGELSELGEPGRVVEVDKSAP
jgi:hypothetical protein